jgi:hypothetical protein
MFFNRRKRYNGDVATLLPAFGIDMQEGGILGVLGILDHAWDDKYSIYEAALVLAYRFAFMLYENKELQRADRFAQDRLKPIQADWIKKGIVRPQLMEEFAKRLEDRIAMARKQENGKATPTRKQESNSSPTTQDTGRCPHCGGRKRDGVCWSCGVRG